MVEVCCCFELSNQCTKIPHGCIIGKVWGKEFGLSVGGTVLLSLGPFCAKCYECETTNLVPVLFAVIMNVSSLWCYREDLSVLKEDFAVLCHNLRANFCVCFMNCALFAGIQHEEFCILFLLEWIERVIQSSSCFASRARNRALKFNSAMCTCSNWWSELWFFLGRSLTCMVMVPWM